MTWRELEGESSITKSYVAWIFESLNETLKKIEDEELKDNLLNDLILLKNHCFNKNGINEKDLTKVLPTLKRKKEVSHE